MSPKPPPPSPPPHPRMTKKRTMMMMIDTIPPPPLPPGSGSAGRLRRRPCRRRPGAHAAAAALAPAVLERSCSRLPGFHFTRRDSIRSGVALRERVEQRQRRDHDHQRGAEDDDHGVQRGAGRRGLVDRQAGPPWAAAGRGAARHRHPRSTAITAADGQRAKPADGRRLIAGCARSRASSASATIPPERRDDHQRQARPVRPS